MTVIFNTTFVGQYFNRFQEWHPPKKGTVLALEDIQNNLKYNLCIYRIYNTILKISWKVLFLNMTKGRRSRKCTCEVLRLSIIISAFSQCCSESSISVESFVFCSKRKLRIVLWTSKKLLGRATLRASSRDWAGSCRTQSGAPVGLSCLCYQWFHTPSMASW